MSDCDYCEHPLDKDEGGDDDYARTEYVHVTLIRSPRPSTHNALLAVHLRCRGRPPVGYREVTGTELDSECFTASSLAELEAHLLEIEAKVAAELVDPLLAEIEADLGLAPGLSGSSGAPTSG